MSLSKKELEQHCKFILSNSRVSNKIIILCEGDVYKENGKLSPLYYKKMENFPDANFYSACIPKPWSNLRPCFFNCGDRNDVLDTYFTLLEMINEDIDNLYNHPKKIFALVDLDIQVKKIDDYHFTDTHQIFCNLYQNGKINDINLELDHEIWITGLIHKEAYFLIPVLQSLFDEQFDPPFYKGNRLLLDDIYFSMAHDLLSDSDLKNSFEIACSRINHCNGLNFSDIYKLRDSWINEFQNTTDEERKHELVFSLLTIRKAKEYWHQIKPSDEWDGDVSLYKNQLLLMIARDFYSKQIEDEAAAKYHIPYFFKMLRKFA
ncbi:MAG: hypothetical protein ACK5RE_09665 [Pseudanabaena sp.]|jgi:hypothetical protein